MSCLPSKEVNSTAELMSRFWEPTSFIVDLVDHCETPPACTPFVAPAWTPPRCISVKRSVESFAVYLQLQTQSAAAAVSGQACQLDPRPYPRMTMALPKRLAWSFSMSAAGFTLLEPCCHQDPCVLRVEPRSLARPEIVVGPRDSSSCDMQAERLRESHASRKYLTLAFSISTIHALLSFDSIHSHHQTNTLLLFFSRHRICPFSSYLPARTYTHTH